MEIVETHLFRVTRDADIAIEEDEADDLLLAIEEEVRRRRFGEAVRLEVERSMPERHPRDPHARASTSATRTRSRSRGMVDLTALWQLVDLDRPDLKAPIYVPVVPLRLLPAGRGRAGRRLRADPGGRHLRPPPVRVVHRLGRAVHRPGRRRPGRPDDQADAVPDLAATRPIVRALIRAAEQGKQVVVLVEIKARFDEENNIVWARAPGAGGRTCRVRAGRPQDALQGRARRAPRGARASGATSTSAPATTTRRPPGCTWTSASCRAARSWAPTSPTCSTCSPASPGSGRSGACSSRRSRSGPDPGAHRA